MKKKLNLLFLLTIFCPIFVEATELSSSYGDATKVCQWENSVLRIPTSSLGDESFDHQKKYNNTSTYKLTSSVFYSVNEEKYELVYEYLGSDSVVRIQRIKGKDGSFTANNLKTGNGYYGDNDLKVLFEKFQCPEYIFIKGSIPNGSGAPMFYYDKIEEGYTSRFGQYYWYLKPEVKRTYDFMSEQEKTINSMLDKYLPTTFAVYPGKSLAENPFCNDLKNKRESEDAIAAEYITKIENQIKKELIWTYFIHSDWEIEDIPDFMLNTNAFDKVSSVVNTKFNSAYEYCQNVLKNDTSLTDEQKAEYSENIGDNLDELTEGLGEYANLRIQSVGKHKLDWGGEENCEGFLGSRECPTGTDCDPAYYLDLTLNIMKYGAIILTFALSTMDFIKATINQDKDQLKKSTTTAVKRLIAAIIIFFLPILINFILSLLGAYNTCGLS